MSATTDMTKEHSRRSSIAGSSHAPSPPPNVVESPPPEPHPPADISSLGDAIRPVIDSGLPGLPAAESQPMTASNSTASNPSAIDTAVGGAAPYGTRSRNRNGSSRPNYAEDKELDVDFDVTAATKDGNGRNKSVRGAESVNLDIARAPNMARKIVTPETDQVVAVQSHHREPIPGTSTFSANPTNGTSQPSKKRKAPGQPTATIALDPQTQGSSQNLLSAQAVTRRASLAAQVIAGSRDSNMLSFDGCGSRLKNKKLVADDGTVLEVNDHVYLVCEPPGEPYYLGRIMEFLHVNNDSTQPIDALRLNWYYRPKDIGRKVNDTRQVFASMHSDISPLTALRGKCEIKHKSEVEKMDELRKTKDCFWYEKLYDRYIHRFYDVIPTSQVINVPVEVKKVLDERWKYIIVEPGRGKELTSAVKSCKRCNKYCASNDSVDCAVCHNTYHMSCVNPPLLKKPSRGFAWACGPCSKAQEKKLEARNTPSMNDTITDAEEELIDEEDDMPDTLGDALDTGRTSPALSNEEADVSVHPGTAEQIHQASLWLFRYLGIHCKVEDALDYDDRIYPRASSRLGPRHQANITQWPGRSVEYVKPAEIKKKYVKGGNQKKDAKLSKETLAAIEADKIERDKRPKWVMDEPPGYIHRGEDFDNDNPSNTSRLLFKPELGESPGTSERGSDESSSVPDQEEVIHRYMTKAKGIAKSLGLPELSTNLLDVALDVLRSQEYNTEKALVALSVVDKKIFKEPDLSPAELKKFEDGVAKFGSEWHSIKKHVKTVNPANIVRFYYTWKKTERGKQVWGNYSGRKGKKEAKKAEMTVGKLQDDVADDYDDSAFDNDKAFEKKRGFQCKFCTTRSSRQWRRAPNTPAGTMIMENSGSKPSAKDKGPQLMVALCRRCAELWRRYAIQWEDIDEVAKKLAQAGGRAWKRKIDEEVLKELQAANEGMNQVPNGTLSGPISANGTPGPPSGFPVGLEPPRKKVKGAPEQELTDPASDAGSTLTAAQQKKKIAIEKPPPPPPPPEPPKARILPCAICGEMEPMGDQHLSCKECRMTVHRNCYGVVSENRSLNKWTCDMCSNDKNPQVSVQYKCVLCPVTSTEQDFVEPPKPMPRKKTEKDRERDRIERENAQKAADFFRRKQEEMNKPLNPREPLKRTANNNWVHVTCAVFTPEVKFGNAKALEPSEGIPSILSTKYDEICKACKQQGGACVNCHSCRAPVHVECAHQAGFILGFDITPVKGSRRDQTTTVDIQGEVGTMAAAIWCKEHAPTKTIVHRMNDRINGTGLNALQLFVQNFKQADLALTGTVRKATLLNQSTKAANSAPITLSTNRRTSTATVGNNMSLSGRASLSHVNVKVEERQIAKGGESSSLEKTCITCGIDVSPRWYPFPSVNRSVTTLDGTSIPSQGVSSQLSGEPLSTGHAAPVSTAESGGVQVALAVAALHQNTRKPEPVPKEFQCHQCRSKKVQKEPSPSPPSPQQDTSKPPPSIPPTATIPTPEIEKTQTVPHYAWPHPSSYPPSSPFGSWSRQSPTPQAITQVNSLNGNHSPHLNSATPQPPNGQPQPRQPVQTVPRSPHQNGHIGQIANGYPTSPHHGMSSSVGHMQNGTYNAYSRPSPQHLTNGGPPPRAPEHPFSPNNSHVHPHGSFGQPHGSPPIPREPHLHRRDLSNPQNNGSRPHDGRVNGGASANPSLRNLLS